MEKCYNLAKKVVSTLLIVAIYAACDKDKTDEISYNDIELEILQLVNQYRIVNNLNTLEMHKAIYWEASAHTSYMINENAISHDNFQERTDILKQSLNANAFAENVAYGQRNAQEVVTAWLNSSGHKKNIEGNYNYTGIKATRNPSGQLYFTQIFAHIP